MIPDTPEQLLTLIREKGIAETCKRFRKPPLPSRLIRALYDTYREEQSAIAFIAHYSLSPSELLEKIAEFTQDVPTASGLANNPRTPPGTLMRLMENENAKVRAAVAINPNLTPREIQKLLQDSSGEVAATLAGNPALRPQHQAVLAMHAEPSVRVALIRNSNLDTPILIALTTDSSPVVRCTLVAQAKAPDELLEFWADCDREEIQLALLQRRNLPDSVLESLWLSPHASVRKRLCAIVSPGKPQMLYLIENGTIEERVWLASFDTLPPSLQKYLSRDSDEKVRCTLARNPALDESIAECFITTGETPECLALLENPALKKSWISAMAAGGNPDIISALMYDHRIDSSLINELVNVKNSAEAVIHLCAQGRTLPDLSPAAAYFLSRYNHPAIKRFALASRAHAVQTSGGSFIVETTSLRTMLKRMDTLLTNHY